MALSPKHGDSRSGKNTNTVAILKGTMGESKIRDMLLDTSNSNSIISDKKLHYVKSFKHLRVIILQLVDRLKVSNNVQLKLISGIFIIQDYFLSNGCREQKTQGTWL